MKIYTYLVVLTFISVILPYAGIQSATGSLLASTGLLNAPQDFSGSTFYITLLAILIGSVGASIVVGFFTRESTESILLVPFVILLLTFVLDYVSILVYVNSAYPSSWVIYILTPIFASLIVGYIVSIAEWWRGTD